MLLEVGGLPPADSQWTLTHRGLCLDALPFLQLTTCDGVGTSQRWTKDGLHIQPFGTCGSCLLLRPWQNGRMFAQTLDLTVGEPFVWKFADLRENQREFGRIVRGAAHAQRIKPIETRQARP